MNDKVTLEQLREKLSEKPPQFLQTHTIGPATINIFEVVYNLLNIIEEQEQRIKALEDSLRGDGK